MKNIKTYGFGVVAQGFHNYLVSNNEEERLHTVIIKNPTKIRKEINAIIETTNDKTVRDKDVDVIVELISSSKEAYGIVVENLEIGKKVISANKKLIAENLATIIKIEKENGGTFLYEGAVCGSVPIIRVLNDLYANEPINEIKGIFNGSSNYILTQLFNNGVSYGEALIQAQRLGFAEADPTSDVGGFDALYKLVLATVHAYGVIVKPEEVLTIGVEAISVADVEFAKKNNLKIKLIAKAALLDGKLTLSVLPTFISNTNDLYNVENEYNAVLVESENIGQQFYKGKGAGSLPTGSVVYSDLKAIDNGYKYSYKKVKHADDIAIGDLIISIYSNRINDLKSYINAIQFIDCNSGYGEIKLSDLKVLKIEIQEKKISIIELTDEIRRVLDLEFSLRNDEQKHAILLKKSSVLHHINFN